VGQAASGGAQRQAGRLGRSRGASEEPAGGSGARPLPLGTVLSVRWRRPKKSSRRRRIGS
jgi:hypothetical protein